MISTVILTAFAISTYATLISGYGYYGYGGVSHNKFSNIHKHKLDYPDEDSSEEAQFDNDDSTSNQKSQFSVKQEDLGRGNGYSKHTSDIINHHASDGLKESANINLNGQDTRIINTASDNTPVGYFGPSEYQSAPNYGNPNDFRNSGSSNFGGNINLNEQGNRSTRTVNGNSPSTGSGQAGIQISPIGLTPNSQASPGIFSGNIPIGNSGLSISQIVPNGRTPNGFVNSNFGANIIPSNQAGNNPAISSGPNSFLSVPNGRNTNNQANPGTSIINGNAPIGSSVGPNFGNPNIPNNNLGSNNGNSNPVGNSGLGVPQNQNGIVFPQNVNNFGNNRNPGTINGLDNAFANAGGNLVNNGNNANGLGNNGNNGAGGNGLGNSGNPNGVQANINGFGNAGIPNNIGNNAIGNGATNSGIRANPNGVQTNLNGFGNAGIPNNIGNSAIGNAFVNGGISNNGNGLPSSGTSNVGGPSSLNTFNPTAGYNNNNVVAGQNPVINFPPTPNGALNFGNINSPSIGSVPQRPNSSNGAQVAQSNQGNNANTFG